MGQTSSDTKPETSAADPSAARTDRGAQRLIVGVEWATVAVLAVVVLVVGLAEVAADPDADAFGLTRYDAGAATPESRAPTYHLQVDVNSADWRLLTLVPGIGESKARAIEDYRRANGPYRRLSDLEDVRGIGEKSVAAWRPYLTLGGSAEP